MPVYVSPERRTILPSTATTSPVLGVIVPCTQRRKPVSNCAGSRRPNTRPKVSWEGTPCSSPSQSVSHACLTLAHSAISTQFSAPLSTPHSVIVRISWRRWRLVRSTRGSVRSAKASAMCGAGDDGAGCAGRETMGQAAWGGRRWGRHGGLRGAGTQEQRRHPSVSRVSTPVDPSATGHV